MFPLLLILLGCGGLRDGEACPCPMPAHGAMVEDRCLCLPFAPGVQDPEPTTTFDVSPDQPPDWVVISDALADGPVLVRFELTTWPERIRPERSDASENRLILDGGGGKRRAVVPGIVTQYEDAVVSHVTVRGFEITGSRDKGVFWNAGDQVVLEDLIVHDNRGTPAINLQYSNRSGHASSGFTVRNTHVYNQPGECIYIGGSEGEEQPSHDSVLLEHNLIHDCANPSDTKEDGINVKDRMSNVVVRGNVVFDTDWGIEVASPGVYEHNLVFRTRREGFQIGDFFGPIAQMHLRDNAVIAAGHDGYHLTADHHRGGEGLLIERTTVIGSGEAGILVAGEFPITVELRDVALVDNPVGLDGWGKGSATLDGCALAGNEVADDRALDGLASDCTSIKAPDWANPAGPDRIFFTADDPWLFDGVGAQLPVEPLSR